MTPDRQLVAFAGEPNGKITLVDWRQPPGQNHKVLRGAGNFTPITENVGDIDADPALWEDALKVSGCANLTVYAGIVRGGSEDCLDVNHSRHCAVFMEDAYPRGNFILTCKGESDDITVTVARQHGHANEVDYDYGNHSDQGNGTTTRSRLSIKAIMDGQPALVRVLRATAPGLDGGPFKWAFPKPFPKWFHNFCVWLLNLFQ